MRKRFRKQALSLFLSGAMALSLCQPAFAATGVGSGLADSEEVLEEQAEEVESLQDTKQEGLTDELENQLDLNEQTAAKKATPSEADKPTSNEDEITETATSSNAQKGPQAEDVQKLIDALPGVNEITDENLEDVKKQLEGIEKKLERMSEEEKEKLDLEAYDKAKETVQNFKPMLMRTKAQKTYNGPSVVLGTDQIQNGSYIYYGHDGEANDPTTWDTFEWLVLDNESDEKLFLLSNLDIFPDLHFAEGFTYASWEKCTLREAWQMMVNDPVFLSKLERQSILTTYNADEKTNDKIFFLSAEEAENPVYFPNGNASRTYGWGSTPWWLRSTGDLGFGYITNVEANGKVDHSGKLYSVNGISIRPAMKINLKNVLFTSDADLRVDDDKPEGLGSLTKIKNKTVNAWRLTLRDDDANLAVEPMWTGNAAPGQELNFKYTGQFPAGYPNLETGWDSRGRWVSAILADSAGDAVYYGQLGRYNASGNKGQISFAIPKDIEPGDYTLKIFHERFEYGTDALNFSSYASDFQDIPLTVKETSTELAAPAKAIWDETAVGKATWTPVERAKGYEVQLYRKVFGPNYENLVAYSDPITINNGNTTSYTFQIKNANYQYAFGVKALRDEESGLETRSETKRFAEANVNELTVEFWTENGPSGKLYDTKIVKKGDKLAEPNQLTKQGYTFIGWMVYDTGRYWDFNQPVKSEMRLEAMWRSNELTAPKNVVWDATEVGKATWSPVENATGYEVQLYLAAEDPANNIAYGNPITVTGGNTTSYTFTIEQNFIQFAFSVKAIGANNQKSAATMSAAKKFDNVNADMLTVNFETDGGSTIAPKKVKKGAKLAEPTPPTKEGYTFVGWYNSYTGEWWDFNDPVYTSMTLVARWANIDYPHNLAWHTRDVGRVRWDAVNGATGYMLQLYIWAADGNRVPEGKEIKVGTGTTEYTFEIDSIYKSYTFGVRAIDKNGQAGPEMYDARKNQFSKVNVSSVDVKFDANGGSPSPLASNHARVGYTISEPSVKRDGYILMGWVVVESGETWNFKNPVRSAMTLQAMWGRAAVSNDATLNVVWVKHARSSIRGSRITVTLPKGSSYPKQTEIVITPNDKNAKVSNLKTSNNGKTWTFTVTASDGKATQDYTLYVSIQSSGGSGGGGGGGSSSGGGGGSFSGSGVNTVGGPGAAGAVNLAPNGTWKSDAIGWKFQKTDGAFPQDAWYECVWNNTKNWYHFNNQGYLNSGWLQDKDGRTYYLHDVHDNSFGYMYTGWHWIGGKCYFFNPVSGANGGLPYGALVKDTLTSDGYTVNAAGEWTVNGVVQLQNQQ